MQRPKNSATAIEAASADQSSAIVSRPPAALPLDPAVACQADFRQAQRSLCHPYDAVCLGVRDKHVELFVFDLDDTLAKLYGPVAKLNLRYLKQVAQQNDVPLHVAARRATTLAESNPDAVVHDPRQLVRAVFGAAIAAKPQTQQLLQQWEQDKRQTFAEGVDRTFGSTAHYFKNGGSKLAILSNSPATPLRERLYLIDKVLQQQGLALLPLIDVIACKPDPAGLTQRPLAAMTQAERHFQTALDGSGKFMVLEKADSKDIGIAKIKTTLTERHRLGQGITSVVQVGDRMTDLVTAHKAGAQAVWITGNLLTSHEKITMRMVGERKVADNVGDALQQITAPPKHRNRSPQTRPHAIIGSIGYLQQLFHPASPR